MDGPAASIGFPASSNSAPYPAEFLADQERIAELQRAAQHQHGRDRPRVPSRDWIR